MLTCSFKNSTSKVRVRFLTLANGHRVRSLKMNDMVYSLLLCPVHNVAPSAVNQRRRGQSIKLLQLFLYVKWNRYINLHASAICCYFKKNARSRPDNKLVADFKPKTKNTSESWITSGKLKYFSTKGDKNIVK